MRNAFYGGAVSVLKLVTEIENLTEDQAMARLDALLFETQNFNKNLPH